ncbi:MAG TPA: hypothetical protein VF541_00490 [Longimicrobium sp.]
MDEFEDDVPRFYRPLVGTFNLYHFRVALRPHGPPNPFAVVCNATVKADGAGSRVIASFGLDGGAKVMYFLSFGWAFVISLLAGKGPVRFPLHPDPSMFLLLVAVCVAFFARWRGSRELLRLEALLERKLKLTAPGAALPRPAPSVP